MRTIDGDVDLLDPMGLAFCDVGSDGGAGQPPYAPGDLLKLARETRRNVEVIWLFAGIDARLSHDR